MADTDDLNNQSSEEQDVQRLGMDSTSGVLPKVLSDLIVYDEEILKKRDSLIKNNQTKGNNRFINAYKKELPKQLLPVVFNWGVGLLLSDTTAQINLSRDNPTCRLKTQAVDRHKPYLDATTEIFKPWVMGISDVSSRNMRELVTLQHEAFLPYVDLFQDPNEDLKPGGCVKKVIKPELANHLDEAALVAWYCGDGHLHYRACQFSCDGFLKADCELLASMITTNFGWKTRVLFDYYSEPSKRDMYYIEIRTESAADFKKRIAPYMPSHFKYKLPADLKRKKPNF